MEVMVVVVIVGLIASFGIPGYQKSVRKSRERNAIIQLTTLHGANVIFNARNGFYLPGAMIGVAAINTGLGINILPAGLDYTYIRVSPTTYTAIAAWGGGTAFTVGVDESVISGANPCCDTGADTCQIALIACPF